MKAKKKHLRKWVRVVLDVMLISAMFALVVYVLIGGVLQTSYRYHAPSEAEVVEAQEGGMWSWITLAKY